MSHFEIHGNTPEHIAHVEKFCDNVKQSLLESLARGDCLHLYQHQDLLPIPYGTGVIRDYTYTGQFQFHLGNLHLPQEIVDKHRRHS